MSSSQAGTLNRRAITALTMLCSFVLLLPSGIIMHFVADEPSLLLRHAVMTIHNTCSLIFVVAALVHIVFNWKSIVHYTRAKTTEYIVFKKEMLISAVIVLGLVLFLLQHVFHVHH
jgi:heme A synthase